MSYLIEQHTPLIFIHIPKTAGRSIFTGLSKNNNIIHIPNNRTKITNNYHSTLADAELFLPTVKDPFVFTVVRNPWDRVSSWFFFRRKILLLALKNFDGAVSRGKVINNKPVIEEEYELMHHDFNQWFIKYYNTEWDNTWFSLNYSQSYWINGSRFSIDKVVKYESLESDIAFLNIDLPVTNQSKKDVSNYRELYTSKTKKIVSKIYEEDLDRFKYSF